MTGSTDKIRTRTVEEEYKFDAKVWQDAVNCFLPLFQRETTCVTVGSSTVKTQALNSVRIPNNWPPGFSSGRGRRTERKKKPTQKYFSWNVNWSIKRSVEVGTLCQSRVYLCRGRWSNSLTIRYKFTVGNQVSRPLPHQGPSSVEFTNLSNNTPYLLN